jgi:hypothetical protein
MAPTSSAHPPLLFEYSTFEGKQSLEYQKKASELDQALTTFLSRCPEYRPASVSKDLAERLKQFTTKVDDLESFTNDVATDFILADGGSGQDPDNGLGLNPAVPFVRLAACIPESTPIPPLPAGAPPPNMSDRHILDKLNFFKAVKESAEAGNSYLLEPLSDEVFQNLYREAYNRGPAQGFVELRNGQIWYIQKSTGKFFPAEGPGIIKLKAYEVGFLRMLSKQIKSGQTPEQALNNLSRAMTGQKYTMTAEMQAALERAGLKLGYSADDAARALAAHMPPTTVAPEAVAAAEAKSAGAAFKYVKWGGRLFLVVGIGLDAYEVYQAENKPKTITKKAGAWAGSLAAGGAAAEVASPLLAGGPWGWAGYGATVLVAGGAGYFVGGEVTETIYEWTFE